MIQRRGLACVPTRRCAAPLLANSAPLPQGAQYLYTRHLRPHFLKYSPKIDVCIDKVGSALSTLYALYKVPIDALVALAHHVVAQVGVVLVVAPGGRKQNVVRRPGALTPPRAPRDNPNAGGRLWQVVQRRRRGQRQEGRQRQQQGRQQRQGGAVHQPLSTHRPSSRPCSLTVSPSLSCLHCKAAVPTVRWSGVCVRGPSIARKMCAQLSAAAARAPRFRALWSTAQPRPRPAARP